MGLDIIEIALDSISDHVDFEKIASEIMRAEGFPNIKPLGGVADTGRDAIQEIYDINEGRTVTVFQYTLEEYLPAKISTTFVKLEKAGIEYDHRDRINYTYHEGVFLLPHGTLFNNCFLLFRFCWGNDRQYNINPESQRTDK